MLGVDGLRQLIPAPISSFPRQREPRAAAPRLAALDPRFRGGDGNSGAGLIGRRQSTSNDSLFSRRCERRGAISIERGWPPEMRNPGQGGRAGVSSSVRRDGTRVHRHLGEETVACYCAATWPQSAMGIYVTNAVIESIQVGPAPRPNGACLAAPACGARPRAAKWCSIAP